ncbi:DUF2270 domain-containing protein [Parvularcula marina]|nr:DUF2270 domain-containing protein [Parvularcula marina]
MAKSKPTRSQLPPPEAPDGDPFSGSEMGAIAHLYRGEVYRSTIWRTRLDATTNWSVVSLGIALSLSYANPEASALPLLLVAPLIFLFLYLEARRYRYFNVWRARARWIEINFYAPLLKRQPYVNGPWQTTLAEDYEIPEHHISFSRAMGRRLRRNYLWIFSVQALAFFGKVIVHPVPLENWGQLFERMGTGPIPGWAAGGAVLGLYLSAATFTWVMLRADRKKLRDRPNPISMG